MMESGSVRTRSGFNRSSVSVMRKSLAASSRRPACPGDLDQGAPLAKLEGRQSHPVEPSITGILKKRIANNASFLCGTCQLVIVLQNTKPQFEPLKKEWTCCPKEDRGRVHTVSRHGITAQGSCCGRFSVDCRTGPLAAGPLPAVEMTVPLLTLV
jgi:hypothetical protein